MDLFTIAISREFDILVAKSELSTNRRRYLHRTVTRLCQIAATVFGWSSLLLATLLLGIVGRTFSTCAAESSIPALATAPFDEHQAQTLQNAWAKYLKKQVELTNSIGMKLVLIPPGEFVMGSPESEDGRSNERQHRVRISKPIYMGVYEVTQAQYGRIMGENPSHFSPSGEGKDAVNKIATKDFPVESTTWERMSEFCNRLSVHERESGITYRLPTEAEWEFAARAGSTTEFPWGDSCNGLEANCDGSEPYGIEREGPMLGRTTTVGSYRANAFGLYDMIGNVREWCSDWYSIDYSGKAPEDPEGAAARSSRIPGVGLRVARGGSWLVPAAYSRSATRYPLEVIDSNFNVGFRVVGVPVK